MGGVEWRGWYRVRSRRGTWKVRTVTGRRGAAKDTTDWGRSGTGKVTKRRYRRGE